MTKDKILDQLIDCEVQIQRLRAISAELRQKLGIATRETKKLSKHAQEAVEAAAEPKRSRMSEKGRRAIAKAQARRWAKIRREQGKAEAKPKKPAAKKQQSARANVRNYWAAMTPEERKAEMARRVAMRKGGVKTLKLGNARKAAAA